MKYAELTDLQKEYVESAYRELRASEITGVGQRLDSVIDDEVDCDEHADWFDDSHEDQQRKIVADGTETGVDVDNQPFSSDTWQVADWERFSDPDQFELILLNKAETKAYKVTMPYVNSKMGYDPDGIDAYLTSGNAITDINHFLADGKAMAVECDLPVS